MKLRSALDAGGRGGGGSVATPLRSALTIGQIACAVLPGHQCWPSGPQPVEPLAQRSGLPGGAHHHGTRLADRVRVQGRGALSRLLSSRFEQHLQGTAGVKTAALVEHAAADWRRGQAVAGNRRLHEAGQPDAAAPLAERDDARLFPDDEYPDRGGPWRSHARISTGRPAVAIVPVATAHKFWPNASPIGRHVRFVGEPHWHTIVGVVADVRAFDLTRDVPEWMAGAIYVPYGPNATMEDGQLPADMTLAVGTTLDPAEVTGLLRRAAASSAGSEVAISDVRAMTTVVADAVAAPAATASLLVTMAGLALVLGSIGVYGVLSFLVSRRTRDLGIRIALGAQRRDLFWLVIKEGTLLCGTGVVIGFAGALAATRLMSSELYGISPTDPVTYATVGIVVTLVTMTACYVPTRRAMRVDPLVVLRDQ